MNLPALSTTTTHDDFVNECEDALAALGSMATIAQRDLDNATERDLKKAAASLTADLIAIRNRKKALGVELLSIMEILGHTKLDTSLLYLNAQDAKKRDAIQGLLNRLTA